MNKEFIIKKNEEILKIIKKNHKTITSCFVIYCDNNTYPYNMYCISVSKKIGNAVTRNRIKRIIKDILMKNRMKLKKKYVIIIRKEAIKKEYLELKEILLNQIIGENNENN